jgi:hypothetical protein
MAGGQVIQDDRLEKALRYLATTDERCAELKGNVERQDYICKLVRAKEFVSTTGPVEQRKALTEQSETVQRAEEVRVNAVIAFEKIRAKRQTEALIVEVWRTEQANRRVGNV